jgi:hypothetical protein
MNVFKNTLKKIMMIIKKLVYLPLLVLIPLNVIMVVYLVFSLKFKNLNKVILHLIIKKDVKVIKEKVNLDVKVGK